MSFNDSLNITESEWYNKTSPSSVAWNPKPTRIAICSFSVLICLIGLVGNGIVIWLLFFRMKRNQATVYTLNLAIADAIYLLGCCSVAIYFLCLLLGVKTSVKTDKVFAQFGEFINNFGFTSSLFLLATLGIERCLLVCFPIWYKCQRPKHLSAITCGIIWGASVLITLLERMLFVEYRSRIYIGTSILFLIVAILMVFCSIVLLVEIQKSSDACRPIKLYIVIIAAVISFFISLAPIRIIRILLIFFIDLPGPFKVILYFVSSLCSALNSCANPYIYILVGRWGKKSSIKVALERVFKEDGDRSTEEEIVSGKSSN
ncbi:mas-related G-protein coupled receptor member H-like [Discoglossus pictus]